MVTFSLPALVTIVLGALWRLRGTSPSIRARFVSSLIVCACMLLTPFTRSAFNLLRCVDVDANPADVRAVVYYNVEEECFGPLHLPWVLLVSAPSFVIVAACFAVVVVLIRRVNVEGIFQRRKAGTATDNDALFLEKYSYLFKGYRGAYAYWCGAQNGK